MTAPQYTILESYYLDEYVFTCKQLVRVCRIAARETNLFYKISSLNVLLESGELGFQVKFDSQNDLCPYLKYYFESKWGTNRLSFYIEFDKFNKFWNENVLKDLPQCIYCRLKKYYNDDSRIYLEKYYNSIELNIINKKADKCLDKDFNNSTTLMLKSYNKKTFNKIKKCFKRTISKWHFNYLKVINEIVLNCIKEKYSNYIRQNLSEL